MSKLKFNEPITHIPSYTELCISSQDLFPKLLTLGVELPFGLQQNWYYYLNLEDWGKIINDLMFKSNLYTPDKRDCDWYASKAWVTCRERYGLNTLAFVNGNSNAGYHAYNLLYHGDGFKLWEPNDGFPFSGSFFEIGEYGYIPKKALL